MPMSRRQLEAENARLRAQLAKLDQCCAAIEGLGDYSATVLNGLVATFVGDPAHERVARAVSDLAFAWAQQCEDLSAALRNTRH